MNLWRWLVTPDPTPGFTRSKLVRLGLRVLLFALAATLLSGLLGLTPLKPYLNTGWGTFLFILVLYVPASKFLNVDTFVVPRAPGASPLARRANQEAARASAERQQRRKEKARYAGVKKGPPKMGGRGR